MGVVLAALLGQVGLPGGGFAYALGSTSNTGKPPLAVPLPTVSTGRNGIADFIPVARIADMLLQPGEKFDYDGQRLIYPDIRLVYWAGGNPFHHHQDLGRLRRAFRRDPASSPLPTPSGKIEIASAAIANFGYADCPGHPAWLPSVEGAGSAAASRFPLHLIANQPATRLHSQLDFGATSLASKIAGREPVRIHPQDAAARGIRDGDVVRLYNDRGVCLAGAVLSDALRPGVVQLSTGAWYDPEDTSREKPLCVHGNPNVVTRDAGTSKLAPGCTGQLTLVEIERFSGPLPPVKAFDPPPGGS